MVLLKTMGVSSFRSLLIISLCAIWISCSTAFQAQSGTTSTRITARSASFSASAVRPLRPLLLTLPVHHHVVPPPANNKLSRLSLYGTIDAEIVIPDEDNDNDNGDEQKERLIQGYTIGKILFLATAAVHLFTVSPAIVFGVSDYARSTEWGAAAGFGLAAGLCHILKEACEADRLQSDTYKRLSVGLLGFCLMGLVAVPGEAALVAVPGQVAVAWTILVRAYGTVLSAAGWKRGFDAQNAVSLSALPVKMAKELGSGSLATLKGMRVQTAKKALTYRNAMLVVGAGMVSNFLEGVFNLRVSLLLQTSRVMCFVCNTHILSRSHHALQYREALGRTWLDASLQWSAVARLFLVACIIYTLKDAAERDRLTGTTFIQLNRLVGGWAVAVALGQMITVQVGLAVGRGVEMAAFGAWFLLKGWKSVKEKKAKAS